MEFFVLLVKEFRNRLRRKLGDNFIQVFKKNNRPAKLLMLANSGRRKEGERRAFSSELGARKAGRPGNRVRLASSHMAGKQLHGGRGRG